MINNISYKPSSIHSLSFRQGQMPVNQFVTANGDSFENSQKTQDKKKFTWKAVALSVIATLGAIGVGLLVHKHRMSAIPQLASHIDFKKATTLKEAEKFAKKNLGIKKYNVDDLQIANFVNEALTRANNAGKGKIVLPNSIIVKSGDFMASTGYGSWGERVLNINPDVFPTTVMKKFTSADKQAFEKCSDYLSKLSLARSKNAPQLVEEGPFHEIFHEIGHTNHMLQSPELFKKYHAGTGYKMSADPKIMDEIIIPHVKACRELSVQENIGQYAMAYPNEYVAEVYAHMLNGFKFPKAVMELYKKYGGPAIEGICK